MIQLNGLMIPMSAFQETQFANAASNPQPLWQGVATSPQDSAFQYSQNALTPYEFKISGPANIFANPTVKPQERTERAAVTVTNPSPSGPMTYEIESTPIGWVQLDAGQCWLAKYEGAKIKEDGHVAVSFSLARLATFMTEKREITMSREDAQQMGYLDAGTGRPVDPDRVPRGNTTIRLKKGPPTIFLSSDNRFGRMRATTRKESSWRIVSISEDGAEIVVQNKFDKNEKRVLRPRDGKSGLFKVGQWIQSDFLPPRSSILPVQLGDQRGLLEISDRTQSPWRVQHVQKQGTVLVLRNCETDQETTLINEDGSFDILRQGWWVKSSLLG